MKFNIDDLKWLTEQGILSSDQARKAIDALQLRHANRPQFSLGHVIYYFGALLVISVPSRE